MELLSQLLKHLSRTIKTWDRFSSGSTGDIGYFANNHSSPESDTQSRLSLQSITETFESLKDLEQELISQKEFCYNSAAQLQLRLTRTSTEAAQYSGVNTQFALLALAPFALATAYFSMPQSVIPFRPTFKSFVATVVIFTIVVKLVSVIFSAFSRRSWSWMKTVQYNGICAHLMGNGGLGSVFTRRKGRAYIDSTIRGIDMETITSTSRASDFGHFV